MNLTISVVIPTCNRPELLREAVDCMLAQTLLPLQILIVDDASDPPVNATDFTGFGNMPIHVLRHPKSLGGVAAKNTGAHAAQGGSAGVSG